MGKERWVGAAEPVEPISRAFGLVAHPLELATRPPDDIGIDPLQGRAQLRPVEVAVVGDPAADARVVHLGQLSQGFIAAVVQRPAVDIAADARQCLRASRGLEAVREYPPSPTLSFGLETGSRESQSGCWGSRRAGSHPCSRRSLSSQDAAPACRPQSGRQSRPRVPAPPRRSCNDK
jgi:hypothetical protein